MKNRSYDFGYAVKTGWVRAVTGILVNSATPTSINSLFGNSSTDGFTVLKALDTSHDGVINVKDSFVQKRPSGLMMMLVLLCAFLSGGGTAYGQAAKEASGQSVSEAGTYAYVCKTINAFEIKGDKLEKSKQYKNVVIDFYEGTKALGFAMTKDVLPATYYLEVVRKGGPHHELVGLGTHGMGDNNPYHSVFHLDLEKKNDQYPFFYFDRSEGVFLTGTCSYNHFY